MLRIKLEGMKISNQTLEILRNLAEINKSITVDAGNELRTVSPMTNIVARVNVTETFPNSFSIYDLNEFLRLVNSPVFVNGDFTFGADSLQIEKGNASTTYRYADKSTIKTIDKNIKFPKPEVKFTLTEYDLKTIIDMARILSYPDLKISSSGENMYLSVVDKKVAGSNTFDLDLGIGNGDTFEMLMKVG